MLLGVYTILLVSYFAYCDNIHDLDEKLIGIKTLHKTIDKDTVVATNMKLDRNSRANKSHKSTSQEPKTYKSFPEEVASHVEQFKRNMTECLKEVQTNDKRIVKPLSPNKDSPVHGECLIACVLKRNGIIEKGKIRKDNLITLVQKFFAKDEKLMKKLIKNLDRCIATSIRNKDECVIAARLNECTNDIMANNKNRILVNY